MKIEKKIVSDKSSLSYKAKAGIATLLGMSAVFMSACNDDNPVSGQMLVPTEGPGSSDSSTDPQNTSSSSAIDIPLSHESLSSEAVEALSSASEKSMSTPVETSSSATAPASSAAEPASSAVAPASSAAEPASSAEAPTSSATLQNSSANDAASSSSVESPASSNSIFTPPNNNSCETTDSTGVKVILCQDDGRGLMASMVSTYDMSDLS